MYREPINDCKLPIIAQVVRQQHSRGRPGTNHIQNLKPKHKPRRKF